MCISFSDEFVPEGILPDENEQQDGKCPQGGASIAQERQWNPDDRQQRQGHADVDEDMEEKEGGHRISIYLTEFCSLTFCYKDDPDE